MGRDGSLAYGNCFYFNWGLFIGYEIYWRLKSEKVDALFLPSKNKENIIIPFLNIKPKMARHLNKMAH